MCLTYLGLILCMMCDIVLSPPLRRRLSAAGTERTSHSTIIRTGTGTYRTVLTLSISEPPAAIIPTIRITCLARGVVSSPCVRDVVPSLIFNNQLQDNGLTSTKVSQPAVQRPAI